MTERFRNPVIKYTTDTLKTLPGSILYFYQNGTSTPKTVYADKNKVTSLGSTVTADSAGIFVAVFLDGTYRVTLKNAAGTTQTGWPVDNVGGEDTTGQFDDWSSITVYSEGDIVTGSNGLRYVAIYNASQNLNQDPTTSPLFWDELRLTLEYNALSTFASGDRVFYTGNMYVSLQGSNTGNTPSSNSAWWKQIKEYDVWNSSTTYASGAYVFDGEQIYISKQNTNLNHDPSADTTETWWKPEWQTISQLTEVLTLTGGGNLFQYRTYDLTDGSTYNLPLANTVPSGAYITAGKPELYKGSAPIVSRSGSDSIRYNGGTDTTIRFNALYGHRITFKSNGTNEWSI